MDKQTKTVLIHVGWVTAALAFLGLMIPFVFIDTTSDLLEKEPPPSPPPTSSHKPDAAPQPPKDAQQKPTACPVRQDIDQLNVALESNTPYDRDAFGYRSGTRDVVLDQERLPDGWYSPWDGKVWSDPDKVQVDHLVALSEAWDSGADKWTPEQRSAFANDINDPDTLMAITTSVNQAKSDSDPSEWLPDKNRELYLSDWVHVKMTWHLSVDPAEKAALLTLADTYCPLGGK